MIIYSSSFAVHVVSVSHALTGESGDKLGVYRGLFNSAAKTLLDGKDFSSTVLSVQSGGLPTTPDSLLVDVSLPKRGGPTDVAARSSKGKAFTLSADTLLSGTLIQDLVCSAIKANVEIETINRLSKKEGIGLDGKMTAQRQRAINHLESILKKPCFLAASAQEIWRVDNNSIEISRTLGAYPSISGIESRFSGTSLMSAQVQSAEQRAVAYFKKYTSLTTDEFNTQIKTHGMGGWFKSDTPTTFISRVAPITWSMDKFTRKLFDHKHLHYYHFNRFARAMISGPADGVLKVGAERFNFIMKHLRADKVSSFSVESLSEYFVAMGCSDVDLLVRKIELDFLIRGSIVDVSFVDTNHSFLAQEPLLMGQIDSLPPEAQATSGSAWGQSITFDSEENVEGLASAWSVPHPDFILMRDHLVNVLSFYQTIARNPRIVSRLDNAVSFIDSAATLKSLGMSAVVPRNFIVEVPWT